MTDVLQVLLVVCTITMYNTAFDNGPMVRIYVQCIVLKLSCSTGDVSALAPYIVRACLQVIEC